MYAFKEYEGFVNLYKHLLGLTYKKIHEKLYLCKDAIIIMDNLDIKTAGAHIYVDIFSLSGFRQKKNLECTHINESGKNFHFQTSGYLQPKFFSKLYQYIEFYACRFIMHQMK